MNSRLVVAAALLAVAGPSFAQNTTSTYPQQPQAQPAYPPPAQTAPQTYPPPAQAAPPAYPPPAQTAPQSAPQATTPPQSGASQQVVVNPPGSAAPAPSGAPSNIQVNPGAPAQTAYPQQPTVVVEEHRRARSPMAIVLTDALYGGGAGALVGLGVGLIEQGSYARDVLIGTGVGLLAGSVVGGIHAYSTSTGNDIVSQRAHARDGLGTLAKDRELRRPVHQVAALTFNY